MKQKYKGQTIQINSDSMSSLFALTTHKITSSLVLKTIYIWNSIATLNTVNINWIKAHNGNAGNERADTLAKIGADNTLAIKFHTIKTPFNHIKNKITEKTNTDWQTQWNNRHDCRQTKLWFPSPDPQKTIFILNQPRELVRHLTQFITGFNNLGYHTFNKLEIDQNTAKCRLCRESMETAWHLANECPAMMVKSIEIFGMEGPGEGNWSPKALSLFLHQAKIYHLITNRPNNDDEVE